jgi:K+-sensing histidine kinase KdpD
MEEFHLFPYVSLDKYVLKDGEWISAPVFCKKRFSEKCRNFYESIRHSIGCQACPCGLSCYVNMHDGNALIYTCVRIRSFFDRKKTKRIIDQEYSPIFPQPIFENIVRLSNQVNASLTKERESAAQKKKVAEEFINITIHEVRKLNSHIKAQSEELSKTLDLTPDNLKRITSLQKNIFATSSLISMRLDTYDFRANPHLIDKEKTHEIAVYKLFDKIRHCLRVEQEKKNRRILFDGESTLSIQGYDIFGMLPFVLLDNAVKFSPPNENIRVTFFEQKRTLAITIQSVGPPLNAGEEEKVFEESYRGEHAKNVATGSGIGLTLAKWICDIHDIEISVRSEPTAMGSLFIVTLEFDPARLIPFNPGISCFEKYQKC